MEVTFTNQEQLKRRIMRRVWYSFAVSVLVSYATLRGFLLGFSGVLFIKLVSVPSILNNLLGVEVRAVPDYVWNSFAHAFSQGEFVTLISLGVIVFSLLSLGLPKRPEFFEGNITQRA